MKKYKRHLVAAITLGAVSLVMPTFGQGNFGSDTQAGQYGIVDRLIDSSDELIERAFKAYQNLPEETQQDLLAYQQGLAELRTTWENEYQPGEGATLDEIIAAREAYVLEMTEEIQASRELRMEIVASLRSELRDRFEGEAWTDEARAQYEEYNQVKRELAAAWAAVLADLGGDATREDIAAAREQFKLDYADVIAEQKELAKQLRQAARQFAQENRPYADREVLPPELQALRDEIQAERQALREQRREAFQAMAGMTAEEREAARLELLEEMKQTHNEIKERRRQIIEGIGDMQDGDRRPED
ncbi:hypothetical protein [Pelagicoccus albus]|uniref:Lipase chaperone n=1 Tax=Pelagicoccus albus TaxID=415222 RepID=A0A7X1E817_9BACT|nr:hypothetical protein [Pelagicoccus albus]MBC2606350.1 hypothetical protein [Pelagicoccus albus]